jgi:Fic family protein
MNPKVPNNELAPLTAAAEEETAALRRLAEEARVAIELLNYQVGRLPTPNLLLDLLPYQEAKGSSRIENIVTTHDELYRAVAFGEDTESAKEVVNYKKALFGGLEILRERSVLSVGDVETIHGTLGAYAPGLRSNLPQFENTLTRLARVKNGVREIIYTPPHGKPLLQRLLLDMLEYVYDDDRYPVHPLIKIALAHRQFERIHPFQDGNGRTGRILNILFLCQKGYLAHPVLYASGEILRRRDEYYAAFAVPEEKRGAERFAEFMLEIFRDTARRTLEIVNRIGELAAHHSGDEFLGQLKGRKSELRKAMAVVFGRAYVRINDLTALGLHRETASRHLKQLVDKGVLREEKSGRDKVFMNETLLGLFKTEETA